MQPGIKLILLSLLVATLFIYRVDLLLRQEAGETIAKYAGTSAVVAGSVADDPDVRDTGVRVVFDVATVNGKAGKGSLLVTLPRGFAVAYGERLELRGLVELPQNFLTQTGREFDYAN